jgi:hypothetical protein
MNRNKFIYPLTLLTVLAPAITLAQQLTGLRSLVGEISGLIDDLWPVMFGLAFIFFFWGMGQFILKESGESKAREEGKKKMLWGIIALFVIVSIMGILHWIGGTVNIDVNDPTLGM